MSRLAFIDIDRSVTPSTFQPLRQYRVFAEALMLVPSLLILVCAMKGDDLVELEFGTKAEWDPCRLIPGVYCTIVETSDSNAK